MTFLRLCLLAVTNTLTKLIVDTDYLSRWRTVMLQFLDATKLAQSAPKCV